jgi:protein subunit release factor A
LEKEQFKSSETIRTYHAADNRVKDHASGFQQPYGQVLDDPTDMIDARANFKLRE